MQYTIGTYTILLPEYMRVIINHEETELVAVAYEYSHIDLWIRYIAETDQLDIKSVGIVKYEIDDHTVTIGVLTNEDYHLKSGKE